MNELFVTATGTGVGKTWLTRGLAAALRRRGRAVAAVKPIETGCAPDPLDALALARACGRPALARAEGLYRARPPLAPYAATLAGEPAFAFERVLDATRRLVASEAVEVALVEGAGGLLVPLDASRTVADLIAALDCPLVLVTRDELGVLSYTLTAAAVAAQRGLPIRAVVLSPGDDVSDVSPKSNRAILAERLSCPVLPYAPAGGADEALADAAEPLLEPLGLA
jgi:dethiobiotin synthetase